MTNTLAVVTVVTSLKNALGAKWAIFKIQKLVRRASMKVSGDSNQARYMLTHNLINQLTVIALCCDLLVEGPADEAENSRRLNLIRTAARSIADELGRYQCDFDDANDTLPAITPAKTQLPC